MSTSIPAQNPDNSSLDSTSQSSRAKTSHHWTKKTGLHLVKTSIKVKIALFILFLAVSAAAYTSMSLIDFRSAQAEEAKISLSFSETELGMVPSQTKQVKVIANIPTAQKLTGLELAIAYDPQKIESVEIVPLNTIVALSQQTSSSVSPNKALATRVLGITCATECQTLSGTQEVATLNIKTQNPVENGSSSIQVDDTTYISVIANDLNAMKSSNAPLTVAISGGQEITIPNPVAEWRMDSFNGSSTPDSSNSNNTLTLNQITSNNDAVSGSSLKFSGSGYAFLNKAGATGLLPATSPNTAEDFTLSAWVKLDRINQRNPIIAKQGNEQRGFLLSVEDNNRLTFEIFKDQNVKSLIQSNSSLQAGKWYHLAATYDYVSNASSVVNLYIDGQLAGSSSTVIGPVRTNDQNLELGRYFWNSGYSRYLSGSMDLVALYSSAIPATSISQIYAHQLAGGTTATPVPSSTPEATPTPSASATPVPSASPTATPTPTPSATPESTPEPTPEVSDALSHWSFNEGSGNTAASSGTNTSALQISNGKWASGISGSALELNGSSTYGRSTSSSLNSIFSTQSGNSGDFTIAAWIKLDKLGHRHPIMSKQGNEQRGFLFSVEENNKLQLQFYKNSSNHNNVLSSNSLDTNWHHVAATYDYTSDGKSVIKLYIDGKQVGQSNRVVGPMAQNSQSLEVGRYNWSSSYKRYFDGLIDEAYVFKKVLSGKEIEDLASK